MVLISTKTAPARETVQIVFTKKCKYRNFYDCNSITNLIITEQLLRLWLLAHCEHHIREAACLYLLHMHCQRIFEEKNHFSLSSLPQFAHLLP
jgi:hypothetical protein